MTFTEICIEHDIHCSLVAWCSCTHCLMFLKSMSQPA